MTADYTYLSFVPSANCTLRVSLVPTSFFQEVLGEAVVIVASCDTVFSTPFSFITPWPADLVEFSAHSLISKDLGGCFSSLYPRRFFTEDLILFHALVIKSTGFYLCHSLDCSPSSCSFFA